MASAIARGDGKKEKDEIIHGSLAQLVERRSYKADVGGSRPSGPTTHADVA
jgi:hypothetical protein